MSQCVSPTPQPKHHNQPPHTTTPPRRRARRFGRMTTSHLRSCLRAHLARQSRRIFSTAPDLGPSAAPSVRISLSAEERAAARLSEASLAAAESSLLANGVCCFEAALDERWVDDARERASKAAREVTVAFKAARASGAHFPGPHFPRSVHVDQNVYSHED